MQIEWEIRVKMIVKRKPVNSFLAFQNDTLAEIS